MGRFLLDGAVQERLLGQFPAGTFVVNTIGSLGLGILTGLALGHRASLVLAGGLLGSFTTFSTWVFDDIRAQLESDSDEIVARIEDSGDEVRLSHDFAPKEREILLAGGLLAYLKSQ